MKGGEKVKTWLLLLGAVLGFAIVPTLTNLLTSWGPQTGFWGWALICGVYLIARFLRWFSEVEFLERMLSFVPVVGLVVAVLTFGWWLVDSQLVKPARASYWELELSFMGLSPDTPLPRTKGEFKSLLQGSDLWGPFPAVDKRPGSAECLDALAELVRTDDFEGFKREWSLCKGAHDRYYLEQYERLAVVKPQSFWGLFVLALALALIGIWVSRSFEGVGKLTGAILWCTAVAAWIIQTDIPWRSSGAAWSLFWWGVSMRGLELVLALGGVIWTAMGLAIGEANRQTPAIWRVPTRVLVTLVATVLVFGYTQASVPVVISQAVVNSQGLITADEAYRLIMVGLQAGTTITAMVSTAILLANAALAAPKK